MNRVRVAVGLLIAIIGTAWSAGALSSVVAATVGVAPYLLLVWAAVAGVRVMAPRGSLTGPAVLAAAGGLWLIVRTDMLGSVPVPQVLAIFAILGGCVVALTGGGRESRHFGVRRFRSLLYPDDFNVTGRSPSKLTVLSVLSSTTLDLSGTDHEVSEKLVIEIDITEFASRVEIKLPETWTVLPGRILATGVRFEGEFNQQTPVGSVDDLEPATFTVVINLVGLRGRVVLSRCPQQGRR